MLRFYTYQKPHRIKAEVSEDSMHHKSFSLLHRFVKAITFSHLPICHLSVNASHTLFRHDVKVNVSKFEIGQI